MPAEYRFFMKLEIVSSVIYLRRWVMKKADSIMATVPAILYQAPPIPRLYPFCAAPMVDVPPIWNVTNRMPTVAQFKLLPPLAHWAALVIFRPARMPMRQITPIRTNINTESMLYLLILSVAAFGMLPCRRTA